MVFVLGKVSASSVSNPAFLMNPGQHSALRASEGVTSSQLCNLIKEDSSSLVRCLPFSQTYFETGLTKILLPGQFIKYTTDAFLILTKVSYGYGSKSDSNKCI